MPNQPPPGLPLVRGPKLPPFSATGYANIKFVEPLGQPEDLDARVWKVEIDGKSYALKMFPFVSWEFCRRHLSDYLVYRLKSPQLYFDYYDPFACECRAYGRLKDEAREDLAVRTHGYLFLTPEQERHVMNMCLEDQGYQEVGAEPDSSDFWGRLEDEHHGQPVRAILKDLVTPDMHSLEPFQFRPSHIPQMLQDLETLHSLGILVRDIHYTNYVDGKLVDFSRAWTVYHPSLHLAQLLPCELDAIKREDFLSLQRLIWDYWQQNAGIMPKDFELPQGLANSTVGDEAGEPHDPLDYDWRKWGREDDEFIFNQLFIIDDEQ